MMPPPVHALGDDFGTAVCGYTGPKTVAYAGARPISCEACLDELVRRELEMNPVPSPSWFGA